MADDEEFEIKDLPETDNVSEAERRYSTSSQKTEADGADAAGADGAVTPSSMEPQDKTGVDTPMSQEPEDNRTFTEHTSAETPVGEEEEGGPGADAAPVDEVPDEVPEEFGSHTPEEVIDSTPMVSQEEPPPKASEEALEYIRTAVAETDLSDLLFKDRLVTVSDTNKELGELTVSVERIKYMAQHCLLVHASSNGVVDGVPCGASVVCYVCPNTLTTLEQHHHEFVKLQCQPVDRKTVIIKEKDRYVVNRTFKKGKSGEEQSTTATFPLDMMEGFISEGTNMLLHRYFVLHGMPQDPLEFIAFDCEGNLCPSVYSQLESRTQKVENTNVKVMGVERTIDSTKDIPCTWQTYLTSEGFIANRAQVGSPVTMTLLRIPSKREEQPDEKPHFKKEELSWDDDMQTYSMYLDRKKELKNSHDTFIRHHPELRALLADFLQFLLLVKPSDVVQFSADYFAPFSTSAKPGPVYKASAVPSPHPHCKTNPEIERLRAWYPEDKKFKGKRENVEGEEEITSMWEKEEMKKEDESSDEDWKSWRARYI